MKCGSLMSNSIGSVGGACSWAAPVVALFSLFEGDVIPSLSSGSNESTWGSSVMTLSFLLADPLGGECSPVGAKCSRLSYLCRPQDWVLASGVDNWRAGFWLTVLDRCRRGPGITLPHSHQSTYAGPHDLRPQGEGEEQEEGEGRDADEGSAGPHIALGGVYEGLSSRSGSRR